MKHRSLRFTTLTALAALSIFPLAACSASSATASLVVVDGALRSLESDCAGANSYRNFHAGAKLTITDSHGTEVSTTKLAPGTAIKADTRDYGVAKRVPTYCAFEFDAANLVEHETYSYSLDGVSLGEFTAQSENGEPLPVAHPALGDPASALEGTSH